MTTRASETTSARDREIEKWLKFARAHLEAVLELRRLSAASHLLTRLDDEEVASSKVSLGPTGSYIELFPLTLATSLKAAIVDVENKWAVLGADLTKLPIDGLLLDGADVLGPGQIDTLRVLAQYAPEELLGRQVR